MWWRIAGLCCIATALVGTLHYLHIHRCQAIVNKLQSRQVASMAMLGLFVKVQRSHGETRLAFLAGVLRQLGQRREPAQRPDQGCGLETACWTVRDTERFMCSADALLTGRRLRSCGCATVDVWPEESSCGVV